jgi:hypothetical protein
VEEKFSALAEGVLSQNTQNRVKEAIWRLERVGSINELMSLMEADVVKTKAGCSKALRSTRKAAKPALA